MKRQVKRLWVLLVCLCMALMMTAVPVAGAEGNAASPIAQAGETGINGLGAQTVGEAGTMNLGVQSAGESGMTAQTAPTTGSEGGEPAVLNENGG